MLLKNYFVYNALLFGLNTNKMKSVFGTEIPVYNLLPNSKCLVGSGTTPTSVDDFKLENEITDATTTFTVNVSDNGTKVVNIISNLSSHDMLISEVGIACYQNENNCFLMTRTVLEEPIMLEVGDVVVIETQFA